MSDLTFKVGDRVIIKGTDFHGLVVQVNDYNNSGMTFVAVDKYGNQPIPYYSHALEPEEKK